MTELGEQLVLALRTQGFGITFEDGDMVVVSSDKRHRHHVPMELLEDPRLTFVLAGVIGILEEDLGLRWDLDEHGDPGLN